MFFLQGCGMLPKENYGGGSGMLTDLLDFLNYLAPLILASLAFITAFKAGLFNIGIAGQMLLAGFTATVLIGYNKGLSAVVAKPLVLLIGLVVGGMTGALIGWLKYRFNIHEVVSTIMLNYIISYLTGFFINNNYVDLMTRNSKVCSPDSRLTLTNVMIGDLKCKIPLGLIAAILAALLVSFLFRKTVLGFEIKETEDTSNVYLVKDGTLFLLYGRKDFEQMTSHRYEYIKGLNGHFEIALYVDTFDEVDTAFKNAVKNGAVPVLEPELEPWGQKTCYIADPEGNLIEIGSWNKPYEEKD